MNISSFQEASDRKVINMDSFDETLNRLRANVESYQKTYIAGEPYPHVVIDDLFDPEMLDRVVDEFPSSNNRDWLTWDTKHELKSTSKGINGLSTFTQLFCLWLNSSDVINEVKKITGLDNLYGDPTFHGAGLHEMYRDGWLEIHSDYTKHYYLPMMRRLNLITYLNRDWEEAWGGELALQDYKDSSKQVSYAPYFNRTIIFPTTEQTLHGVPNKLACPENCSRKLLSIYYWTPIPMPFLFKVGTPLIWVSDRKKVVKQALKNVHRLFH
jgi:hypothetical protein